MFLRIIIFFLFLMPALSNAADTNIPKKTFKVYMVLWSGEDPLSKGFQDYLHRKKIPVEYVVRNCNLDRKKCHTLVKEIRVLKPDLIFTWGTPVCEEIGGKIDASNKDEYIWDIPIVALIVTDPIRSKVIYDLKNPGRNITGVNHVAPVSSHIETMKSYLKDLKTVAAFYNPNETNSRIMVEELNSLSRKFNVQVKIYPVHVDKDNAPIVSSIPTVMQQIKSDDCDFIYMPADTFLSVNMEIVSKLAKDYRIPTFGSTESMFFTEHHPLLGVLSRFYDVGLLGGVKAEQILMDKKDPQDLPYEKLSTFSILIAPDVFKSIKIYPPISMVKISEIVPQKGTKDLVMLDPSLNTERS